MDFGIDIHMHLFYQPWATLFALDCFNTFTVGFDEPHRGLVTICSHSWEAQQEQSQSPHWNALVKLEWERYQDALNRNGYFSMDELPYGALVGVCELMDTQRVQANGMKRRVCPEQAYEWTWIYDSMRSFTTPVEIDADAIGQPTIQGNPVIWTATGDIAGKYIAEVLF